jgi:RNA polymerase sigma-70 factor (ECF subfamily)
LLLTALDRFLHDAHSRSQAAKRGGRSVFISRDARTPEQRYALEPVDSMTADRIFERRWALTLLEDALQAVEAHYLLNGHDKLYAELKAHCLENDESLTYADIGCRLGLSEGAVKMQMLRLRRRFQLIFRKAVAETVADSSQIESEIAYLFSAFSSPLAQHAFASE